MTSNQAYSQYKENSITTASQEELTLMLYNGLIKFVMKAQYSIEKKDIQGAHNNIIRAQDIVMNFINTLDRNYEVSQSMYLLYDYMNSRLIEANMKKDPAILEEVLDFAKDFRDTWVKAMKLAKIPQKQVAASVAQ